MGFRHGKRILVAAIAIVVTTGDLIAPQAQTSPRLVFVEGDPPSWCHGIKQSSSHTELQTITEELFARSLLRPASVAKGDAVLKIVVNAIHSGKEPIFVSMEAAGPTMSGVSERLRPVTSFDGLRGPRWEILIHSRDLSAIAPYKATALILSWDRIRPGKKRPFKPAAVDIDIPVSEVGAQTYCATKSGNRILVSLVQTTST